jgi:exodeoxyribonuclease V alpha subunit
MARMDGTNNAVAPSADVLAGLVERVTFHNAETGFCVLRAKVRGQRDLVTVVGHAALISAGEFISASGVGQRPHPRPAVQGLVPEGTAPTTLEGIEKYLGSGHDPRHRAGLRQEAGRAFGEAVFDLIEQEPDRLREVTGIGPKRAARIVAGWAEQKVIREIMLFLHSNGVGTSRAVRIYKTYGPTRCARQREPLPARPRHPRHRLPHRRPDRGQAGHRADAMIRVRAGISFALAEAMEEGPLRPARERAGRARTRAAGGPEALVGDALAWSWRPATWWPTRWKGSAASSWPGLYRAEREIAERLRSLSSGVPPWPAVDADKAIPWVEAKTGLTLAESQQAAMRLALASKVLVITGGPGVGKTTLVNSILKIVAAKGPEIALCAPTGRAAKRLAESTGRDATTIHRLLEADPKEGGFKRTDLHPLGCDLLVVDEASMVDVPLMRALLKALPEGAALLLVGDVDQLPSVGPGQVLADVIASGAVPVVRLTEVFRQAAGAAS